jgi:hypothetical protein
MNEEAGNGRKWSRRVRVAIGWAVLNFGSLYLVKIASLDMPLLTSLVDKSTWIACILIAGISGTDAIKLKYTAAQSADRTKKNLK